VSEKVLLVAERHCVVIDDDGKSVKTVTETDGHKAVTRAGNILNEKAYDRKPRMVKLFAPEPSEEYPEDARVLIGPTDIRGKLLSELPVKVLDRILEVKRLCTEETNLSIRAEIIRRKKYGESH